MKEAEVTGKRVQRAGRGTLAVFLGVFLGAGDARAHGGPPLAEAILFEPGRPEHVVPMSPYWGFFESPRPGAWHFLCAEAAGGSSYTRTKRSAVLLAGGRLVVAAGSEGVAITDDGCAFRNVSAFDGVQVDAVTLLRRDGQEVLAVGTSYVADHFEARLFRSTDAGDTWAAASSLPSGFSARSLAVAPSDPSRVYVGGRMDPASSASVARSQDGGATWEVVGVPWPVADGSIRLAGIHPTRPDLFFVRVDGVEDGTPAQADVLFATADAGDTFAQAFAAHGDLPGFTFSPDGTRVLVGGEEDGVQEASTEEVASGGASPFTQVFEGKIYGLTYEGGKLHAGTDDAAPKGVPRLMLGVSEDDGRTFVKVMRHCEITLPVCDAASTIERSCRHEFERAGGFEADQLGAMACPELHAAPVDAGVPAPAPSPPRDGCGVVPGRSGVTGAAACLAALAAALGIRRARGGKAG